LKQITQLKDMLLKTITESRNLVQNLCLDRLSLVSISQVLETDNPELLVRNLATVVDISC